MRNLALTTCNNLSCFCHTFAIYLTSADTLSTYICNALICCLFCFTAVCVWLTREIILLTECETRLSRVRRISICRLHSMTSESVAVPNNERLNCPTTSRSPLLFRRASDRVGNSASSMSVSRKRHASIVALSILCKKFTFAITLLNLSSFCRSSGMSVGWLIVISTTHVAT